MKFLSLSWLKEWKQIYSEGGLKLLISKKVYNIVHVFDKRFDVAYRSLFNC